MGHIVRCSSSLSTNLPHLNGTNVVATTDVAHVWVLLTAHVWVLMTY